MAAPKLDKDRIAHILYTAAAEGDRKAAARWKCTERTVRTYRAISRNDPELSAKVIALHRDVERKRSAERTKGLDALVGIILKLAKQATVENLKDVTDAYKVLDEAELARKVVLGVGDVDREPHSPPTGDAEADDAAACGAEGGGPH